MLFVCTLSRKVARREGLPFDPLGTALDGQAGKFCPKSDKHKLPGEFAQNFSVSKDRFAINCFG
jgi:hypothetical protein